MSKVAFVTGGSSGIGQGTALVLAEQGWDVAFTYRSHEDGAKETLRGIEALGRKGKPYYASFDDVETPALVVNRVHDDFGRIDLMVCNAAKDARSSVLTVTADEILEMCRIDLCGYMLCAGAAARHMVRDGIEGSIIFVTSTRGERAYADDFLYGAMKAGINRACQSMAIDLSPYKIRVNCVAPGATQVRPLREGQTEDGRIPAVPLGRVGQPRDNGELIAFLASDKASYITGCTIRVDGGLILSGPPEGWAEPHYIHPLWRKRHYEEVMKA